MLSDTALSSAAGSASEPDLLYGISLEQEPAPVQGEVVALDLGLGRSIGVVMSEASGILLDALLAAGIAVDVETAAGTGASNGGAFAVRIALEIDAWDALGAVEDIASLAIGVGPLADVAPGSGALAAPTLVIPFTLDGLDPWEGAAGEVEIFDVIGRVVPLVRRALLTVGQAERASETAAEGRRSDERPSTSAVRRT